MELWLHYKINKKGFYSISKMFQYKNNIFKVFLLWVFAIAPLQLNSQQFDQATINEMAKIFGYQYGQTRSIETIIGQFPDLSKDFFIAEIEWNKKFKPSVVKVEKELIDIFGDEWNEFEKSLKSRLDEMINDNITYKESLNFLTEMKERSKGVMDPNILDIFLKNHPKYIANPAFEFSDGFKKNYNCYKCEKSNDLSFSFDYPESWSSRPGKRSMVLFLKKNSNGNVILTCTIGDISESFSTIEKYIILLSEEPQDEVLAEAIFNDEGINMMLSEYGAIDYSILGQQSIKLNMKPGYMFDYSMKIQQLDFIIASLNRTYLFIVDGKVFNFTFQVFSLDGAETKEKFKKNKSLMHMITNSIIFH